MSEDMIFVAGALIVIVVVFALFFKIVDKSTDKPDDLL